MAETFGQRLSRLRKEKGLTQEDIAKRIIISPQAVSKWENDISSPDILVLSSLADILGVSVDVLLGREEESKQESKEETTSEKINEEDVVIEDPKEEYEEGFHKDKEGIHIIDDDGSRVDIDESGIYVTDKNSNKRKVTISDRKKLSIITGASLFGLAIIGYVLMGIFWTDQFMGWKMGWILLLLPIIIESLVEAIRDRTFTKFAYPILVVAAYCTLGFLGGYLGFEGWTFYWFLFITIPAYYLIFGPIDKYIVYRRK